MFSEIIFVYLFYLKKIVDYSMGNVEDIWCSKYAVSWLP